MKPDEPVEEFWDIDRQVAKAIGLQPSVCGRRPNGVKKFSPSTDWNDALFAAEKAFYGKINYAICCNPSGDWWAIVGDKEICGETGPIAICEAILKLKGAK